MALRYFRATFTICGVLYTSAILIWYWGTNNEDYDPLVGRGVITRDYKPTILFHGDWWQKKYPYLEEANERCPRCHFTQDAKYWDTWDTQAIIFHGRMLSSRIPPRGSKLWVFMLFEALNSKDSAEKWRNIPRYDGLFNWTMTYRRDSDIWVPYGRFIPYSQTKPTPLHDHHTLIRPRHSRPSFSESWAYIRGAKGEATYKNVVWEETPSVKDFETKKMAAWIVSRCVAPNGRQDIVAQLRQHGIPIDIYGPCGNYSCDVPKSDALTGVDCRVQIRSKYKFYLAFENSNCVDYVTEKFFDAVGITEMVAVVFGGANYTANYPPKSFINARDFASVGELAKYLQEVSRSREKWLEYFAWRKEYWVQTNRFVTAWCDLCQKVVDHMGNKDKTEVKVYERIWDWWLHKDGKLACF